MTLDTSVKINNKAKTLLSYVLAFGIPLLIIILAYIGLHIAPFGDKTLIISDAKALYMSDLSYIKRALTGQENLLYSFQLGAGMNLAAAHGGLLNPANLIVLLFDITSFTTMYSWLMAIDMAMCGLTMYVFLSSAYGMKNYNLIFSTVYALIGFNVAYCFHFNFLLSVELLPLIALGIIKIIKGKTPWLYLTAIGYAIFASFYFGYMMCIASFVLFLMWYAENRKQLFSAQKKRIWITYISTSITAGLLSAFLWLPGYLSLMGERANQNSITDFTMAENMSIGDAFAKLFIGSNDLNELVNGKPNIFVVALVIFLVIAFFLDKRNSNRTKVIHAIPIAFYFITFYVKALSMMMQGFSVTNWFNHRYSFVFCFLLIVTAFEEFIRIREIDQQDLKKSCIVLGIFVAVIFSQGHSFVSGGWMLLDILILAGCLGAIWWNRVDAKKAPQRVLAMLLILLCSIECYANFVVSTNKITEWGYNAKEYQEDLFYGSVITDSINGSDQSFYRMVNEHATNKQCNNDPRLFGYNGVNFFGSYSPKFIFQGMSRLGLPWYSNRMWYAEGLPEAFDDLFGIKYVASERNLTEEKGYEVIVNIERNRIFCNADALPVGMLVNDSVDSLSLGRNPFENHNNLWRAMTSGEKDVFTQEGDIKFIYHANNDGESINYHEALQYSNSLSEKLEASKSTEEISESVLVDSNSISESDNVETVESIKESGRYIECSFIAQQDGSIYAYNGAAVQDDYGANSEAMHYLGEYKKGDIVTDYISVNTEQLTMDIMKGLCAEYYAAYINDDVLKAYCKQLQSTAGEITKEADSHIVGKIEGSEESRLFFTIPYDEGWTLKVDGVETPLEKTADLFMSASITTGSHAYELTFFPRGMKTGIMITGGAVILLLLLIAYTIVGRKKRLMAEVPSESEEIASDTEEMQKSEPTAAEQEIKSDAGLVELHDKKGDN